MCRTQIRPSIEHVNELENVRRTYASSTSTEAILKREVVRTLDLGREAYFLGIACQSYRVAAQEIKIDVVQARRARHLYKAWIMGWLKIDWSKEVSLFGCECSIGMRAQSTGAYIGIFADGSVDPADDAEKQISLSPSGGAGSNARASFGSPDSVH